MTPLIVAQVVTIVVAGALAVLVGIGAARRRVPHLPALGLLVVILATAAGELRVLEDWAIRAAWLVGFPLVLATYADGRFVPGWTRWLVAASIMLAIGDVLSRGRALDGVAPLILSALGITFLACQAYRYRRRSTIDERVRVRWPVLFTGWAMVSLTVLPFVSGTTVGAGTDWPAALAAGLGMLIPTGLVIGLVRPQLAEVDSLLRESVRWLLVGVIAVVVYVVVRSVATAASGQETAELAAAAAVIAALMARRPARDAAARFVGAARPDPVRLLAALGERFEQSLDGNELANSIAHTVAEALLIPDVEVTVRDVGTESVGHRSAVRERFVVTHRGDRVGVIEAGPRAGDGAFSAQDRALLRLVATHAGPAMHAARVVADLRRARERLVVAREEERRRLRRDLHDELAPQLAGLALSGAAVREFMATDPGRAREVAGRLAEDLRRAAHQVRDLAYDLRPPVLDDLGLTAAIIDRVSRPDLRDGLNVVVDAPDGRLRLPAAVELAALRIVQEAVMNTRKHAGAHECRVVLRPQDDHLLVEVIDDGHGFKQNAHHGLGLVSIAERASEVAGTSDVASSSSGTRVSVRLPIAPDPAQ